MPTIHSQEQLTKDDLFQIETALENQIERHFDLVKRNVTAKQAGLAQYNRMLKGKYSDTLSKVLKLKEVCK